MSSSLFADIGRETLTRESAKKRLPYYHMKAAFFYIDLCDFRPQHQMDATLLDLHQDDVVNQAWHSHPGGFQRKDGVVY